MILAESLVKTYTLGGEIIRALDGVSLKIEDGEMVAVTGASGSGKSTLMHILGCLDQPDGGKYFIGDENVANLSQDRLAEVRNRQVGFVFQTFNLLARMSALENVELPLLYAGCQDAKELAEKALHTVGLSDRMRHAPNQLSGGQRQRVAIARAIVTNPAIILADEPTGNLDTKTGDEIMDIFKSLHSSGRTIVMVTHEQYIADHCQRQICLSDGKIIDDDRG